ncbi:MAG TPA: hypothetical protein VGK47_06165 [Nitrososphaeraceae archaeon]
MKFKIEKGKKPAFPVTGRRGRRMNSETQQFRSKLVAGDSFLVPRAQKVNEYNNLTIYFKKYKPELRVSSETEGNQVRFFILKREKA